MVNIQKTTYRCPITVTNTAKDKIRELGLEEQSFFLLEKSFHVYIEKYPQSADRIVSVALFLDNVANVNLANKMNGQVMVLHCVVKQERFVVTNVTTRPAHIPVQSNWRLPVHLTFDHKTLRNEPISVELLYLINRMTGVKELSTLVQKQS